MPPEDQHTGIGKNVRPEPTLEQKAIIEHPLGKHARVLAVAGSGKTTTMVARVRHLVMDLRQDPARIRVVMFNRLAREDFERKLEQEIFEVSKRPKVLTFHSLALQLRLEADKRGLLHGVMELWIGDREELALICMHRAIDSLLHEGIIDGEVDARDALDAVGLWKASLIPPSRAGHRTSPDLSLIYRRFEELREQQHALTFDDFVPKAMELMDSHPGFRRLWTNKLDHLIVDEYQDINYGQQALIRLLAGDRADVMVVGDDDQTIYEWRGARPYYILQGFKEDFANKETVDYPLSHSFRFGPLLAQAAYNTIAFNRQRAPKPLVAHDVLQQTDITILTDQSEQPTEIALSMADEITILVRKQQVLPKKIGVLARTFLQLEELQMVCVDRRIPFRVLGMGPFFERDENRTLIDYVRLALALDAPADSMKPWRPITDEPEGEEPAQARTPGRFRRPIVHGPTGEAIRTVLAVANTPSRRLPRTALRRAVETGFERGLTVGQSLSMLADPQVSPLRAEQREETQTWLDFLSRIGERVMSEPALQAHHLLAWIVEHTGYEKHFAHYYGEGMASFERITSFRNFINFAARTNKRVRDFLDYLATLDTTLGLRPDLVITMTTVHRTKGLEYEYVFIPQCNEGFMPGAYPQNADIYDTEGIVPDHQPSPHLETERRLFYVAVSRTIKHLYIGVSIPPQADRQAQSTLPLPSRFVEEMQLEQTRPLVEAIQAVFSGEEGDRTSQNRLRLQQTLARHAGRHHLLRSLAKQYLASPALGGLDQEVEALIARTAEVPFVYQYPYPSLETATEAQKAKEKPEIWTDPWAGIGNTF